MIGKNLQQQMMANLTVFCKKKIVEFYDSNI